MTLSQINTFLVVIISILLTADFFRYIRKKLQKIREERKAYEIKEPKSGRWSFNEIWIVAYIAFNHKTSNKELIRYVSACMNRTESSVVRKINRLRGVKTGKSPNASSEDYDVVVRYDALDDRERFYIFFRNMQDLDTPNMNLETLDKILQKSKK